jgi:hypothetical protein
MWWAVEQIRRMRCSDESYDAVKFQNNPQHRWVLVNEMLSTRLGLPIAAVSVVEVPEELIRPTAELCVETPRRLALHDFLADEMLRDVDNLHDFAGMLGFDN